MKPGKMQWVHLRNKNTSGASKMRRRLRSHGAKRTVATSSIDTLAQISSKHMTGWIEKVAESGGGRIVTKGAPAPEDVVATPCGAEVINTILSGHKAGCKQCQKILHPSEIRQVVAEEVTAEAQRGHDLNETAPVSTATTPEPVTSTVTISPPDIVVPATSKACNVKQRIADLQALVQLTVDLAGRIEATVEALENSERLHEEYTTLQAQWVESQAKLRGVLG